MGLKWDINEVVFVINYRWLNVKCVGDKVSYWRIIVLVGDFGDEIINVGRKDVEKVFEELVMVKWLVKF